MKKTTLAVLLTVFAANAPSYAQPDYAESASVAQTIVVATVKDPDMMPYSEAFERMKKFESLPEKDKVYLRFFAVLKSDTVKVSDVRIRLDGDGVQLPVPVKSDGTLDLPYSEAAYKEKAEILTNQKAGTMKIYYGPGIKVPETTAFRYRDLMDGVTQSTAMMKSFWNFLFPSFVGASLRYHQANGQYLTINSKNGIQKIQINESKKSIPVEYDRWLYEENPMVTVSEKPEKIFPFNLSASSVAHKEN